MRPRRGRASTRRDELASKERADYSSLMERRGWTGVGMGGRNADGAFNSGHETTPGRRSIKVASLFSRGNAADPFWKGGEKEKRKRGRGRKIRRSPLDPFVGRPSKKLLVFFSLSRLISSHGYSSVLRLAKRTQKVPVQLLIISSDRPWCFPLSMHSDRRTVRNRSSGSNSTDEFRKEILRSNENYFTFDFQILIKKQEKLLFYRGSNFIKWLEILSIIK